MVWIASGFHPLAQQSLPHTRRDLKTRLRYLAVLWLVSSVVFALLTWICFQLGVSLATTSLIFLGAIVLLSLLDSFVSSAFFSILAVGLIDYYFVQPLYSLDIADPQDIAALVVFLFVSLSVTSLVRRLRYLGDIEREQARLLDLTHDPIMVRDKDDVIRYWNRGAEGLYGWKREEVIGRKSADILQTKLPMPIEQIETMLRASGRWEGELVRSTKHGVPVTVACRWTLERDDRHAPIGTLETNNDITDRKRAEEALRRTQETFLAEAQQLSHTGSFGWNVTNKALIWSEESFKIFGYAPTIQPTVELAMKRVHPEDQALVQGAIERAKTGQQQDFDFEHRLLMPDGTVKHVQFVAHAVSNGPGLPQFMGVVMDITTRKQTELALRDSEQRYRHLFHHMPIPLMQMDRRALAQACRALRAEGVVDLASYLDQHPEFLRRATDGILIAEANARAVKLLGASDAGELLGTMTRFWGERPDTFRRSLEAYYRGEQSFEEETKVQGLDGHAIDVLFANSWPDPVGDLGIIGLIDITERLRSQERLQQVQAEFAHAARITVLGELAASMAHEVNQPLGAMATNAETTLRWLSRPEPNVAKAGELLLRIVADARRAADIIARIRAMATGRAPERVALSLRDVIEESLVFLRYELQAKGVAVSLDASPVLPHVVGDRTQLQQVIVNLVINAAQAMAQANGTQRQLKIETQLSDAETLCCAFEDSGPGIAPDHLHRLFDSFFTTKEVGMGMGLPISRSIVEAHGGRIRADNNSTLGGARFVVELPADRQAAG